MLPRSKRRTKPYKGLTTKSRLKTKGSSNRSKARSSWQAQMLRTYAAKQCERCYSTSPPIDNAHRLKKTKIKSEEEYVHGRAHLCRSCHRKLDEATGEHVHERMYLVITKLMKRRGVTVNSEESLEMEARIQRLGVTI